MSKLTAAQVRSMQDLTLRMQNAAPSRQREIMVFSFEAIDNGLLVTGQADFDQVKSFDRPYLAIAYVGPRGGVRNHREFR